MLALSELSLSFGGRVLLDKIDWQVRDQDRVALIGGNGSGKSTLMKIIAGLVESDAGRIITPKGTTFGYLPQDGIHFAGRPLFEEVKSVCASVLSLEGRLQELEELLDTEAKEGEAYQSLLEEYDRISEEFRQHDGYRIEAEIGRILEGLGFSREDWQKPCEQFSGGWQMRIALAQILLKRPSIMLLDEPTNHLDLEARNWLQDYINKYPAAIILVSHDRFFLDAVVKRCSEIFQGKLTDYFGNFSYYEVERERRYEALEEEARRQGEEIERLERFIERFRYKASKATQVQSRVKQLEKIERIVLPPSPKKMRFSFPKGTRSGKIVQELENVSKAYGDNQVLKDVSLTIQRGERVALVGVNGAGKSTLMRIMADQETFEGERIEGYQANMGYFAQDQAQVLNPDHTVYQAIEEIAPYDMVPRLRSLLGCFLFQGDDIDKKVKVLSGGERNRLAIARMLLRPSNFLLLDEPTNHLDIQAQEILLGALKDFQGTVVFVSHDRFFINQLAERVVEVKDQKLVNYVGNYEYYLRKKEEAGEIGSLADGVHWSTAAKDVTSEQSATGAIQKGRAKTISDEKKQEREKKQDQYHQEKLVKRQLEKKIRTLQKEITSLESALEEKEAKIAELEEEMAQPGFYDDYEKANQQTEVYNRLKSEVEQGYGRWEELQLEYSEYSDE